MAEVYDGAGDFVLFPREQSYSDIFDPQLSEHFDTLQYSPSAAANMHRHRNLAGQARISYDSYPHTSANSSATSIYYSAPNMPFDACKGNTQQPIQRNTPSGSPSPANSQIFDHPSSNISSASCASAHSTASSTDGSPYANAMHRLPYHEKWAEPLHGLGLPEIVNSEGYNNEPFPPTSFHEDLMLEDDKFASCVGECGKNFSPSLSISRCVASSSSSVSASQVFLPTFSPSIMALDTSTANRDVTIDSILEEANCRTQTQTHLISPVSVASAAASPSSSHSKHRKTSPNDRKSSFRSPLTPASAKSRFSSRAASPYGSSEQVPLNHGFGPMDDNNSPRSPRQSPTQIYPYSPPTLPSSFCQSHFENNQNPFFGQSSGRFVAPLESSCWFSLLSPFHLIFFGNKL